MVSFATLNITTHLACHQNEVFIHVHHAIGLRDRGAAVAQLSDLVHARMELAEAQGNVQIPPVLWVIFAYAATCGWQSSSTRCDVCVANPENMAGISQSSSWSTWWVMDGSDIKVVIHIMMME